MALDKVVDSAMLDAGMKSVADAIRAKTGTTDLLAWPDGFKAAVEGIQTGGGQAFQCGTVVSADGTNLVVPCTLDNILIVRKYVTNAKNVVYLLNATLLVADGLKIQIGSNSNGNLTNQGIGASSITKQNGQTTFTQTTSNKFNGEYCYIAWDNAE